MHKALNLFYTIIASLIIIVIARYIGRFYGFSFYTISQTLIIIYFINNGGIRKNG